jgi:hypothetical protein
MSCYPFIYHVVFGLGGSTRLRPVYINGFVTCYPFIYRVVFGLGGLTRLIKYVVFGLGLNMSSHNQIGYKPKTRTSFAYLILLVYNLGDMAKALELVV